MLKKIAKICLVFLVGGGIASPLQAREIEGTVSGEVKGRLFHATVKRGSDSYSYLDMDSEATLGYQAVLKGNSWTTTGSAELTMDRDGFSAGDRFVTLENDSLSFSLGNWNEDAAEITVGRDYLGSIDDYLGVIDESMSVGNIAFEEAGGDYFKLGLKNAGLEFTLGANKLGKDYAIGDEGPYRETLLSAFYGGELGHLTLKANVTSVSKTIDEKENTAGRDSIHDGGGESEVGVGLGYRMGDMALALNFGQYTQKQGGNPAPEDQKQTTVMVVFDMALSGDSGFTVAYGSHSNDDGTPNKTRKTGMDAGYLKHINGIALSIGYGAVTTKDDDTGQDNADRFLGGGLTFEF